MSGRADTTPAATAFAAGCDRRDNAPRRRRELDLGLVAAPAVCAPRGRNLVSSGSTTDSASTGTRQADLDRSNARMANRAAEHASTRATMSAPKLLRVWWRLEFDDGSLVIVAGAGLIGREPAAGVGEIDEQLVVLADDTLSVSRTHLEFGVGDSGLLWISDRASMNGSQIEVNGHLTPIEPGRQVPTPAGCTVHLGSRRFAVRALPASAVIGDTVIDWGVTSARGAVRENNQDAFCTDPPVFVIADGMGGHRAGEVASREAIAAMSALAGHVAVTEEMVTTCLADARARIGRITTDHRRPPGTTLSGVIVTQYKTVPYWMVINIGDSRTYRLNADGLRQISVDHSVLQELIAAGALPPSGAQSCPLRNVVTRALLAGTAHRADVWLLPMVAGDRILVCSDGLTKEIDDEAIAHIVRATPDPQATAHELVRAAVESGGHDNVTAMVLDAVAVGAPFDHRPRPHR